jgi:hypothetical protein
MYVECDCNCGTACPQGKAGISSKCRIYKNAPAGDNLRRMNMPDAPANKTYICTPADGTAAYEVQATSYEFSESSGRHIFKEGEEVVANVLNVSVRRKPQG